ncbi:AI-2E family transporter [Haladaptatus salinisoli]|uniref:AI-2E family transporter n=1 Tax=Haladaptatus salinisoli TaxID=2884876 RepID=UPI001D0B0942|nr:AI-2E family transporter [Haladaptatus salinisoli]
MKLPDDRSQVGWWVLATALFVALLFVAYSFIGTLVLGLFLYYGTRPLYRRVTARVESDNLAAMGTLLLVALPALLLISYSVVVGIRELSAFTGTGIETYYARLVPGSGEVPAVLSQPRRLLNSDIGRFQDELATAAKSLGAVAAGILHLFIAISFAFFALRDSDRLADWFRDEVGDESPLVAYLSAVDSDLATVYFGNVLTVLLVGVAATVVYNAFAALAPSGVSFPIPTILALLTGLATFVPIVVGKLVYVPITAYLAVQAFRTNPRLAWFPAAFFLVSLVFLDLLPQMVVRPYVSGRTTHTGLVMFSYVLGGLLFGWYGIFLGPLVLVLVVQFAGMALGDLLSGKRVTANSSLSLGSEPPEER